MTKPFLRLTHLISIVFVLTAYSAWADHHESAKSNVRSEVTIIEAEVLTIDHESREISLALPFGYIVMLTAGPEVTRLNEIGVGDRILATYMASLAGEVREPTEEEKKQPWVVITDEVTADRESMPGRAAGVMIRAVCTIEGMNRVTGRAMIKDSMGRYHVIEDIPAERFEGVTLGSTVIITYSQAVAIALEKREKEM